VLHAFMPQASSCEPLRLNAGTIYALKANQTNSEGGGSFALTWIELGSANNDELQVRGCTSACTADRAIFLT
jgi:hypothetical protein